MRSLLMTAALVNAALLAPPVLAQDAATLVEGVLAQHVLPGFQTFATRTEALTAAAQSDCQPQSAELRAAFHEGFDAWMAVSHLRFGPSEVDERAFALAFWPDTKGFTPKSLTKFITTEDPVIAEPEAFGEVSIAARGFFAMEYLLYDDTIATLGDAQYHCALVQAVAADIDRQAQAILADWQGGYATSMQTPSDAAEYATDLAAVAQLFKALDTGLQFNEEARLGRPLGSFEKPRPRRAEARRSGRSLRNITVSLTALEELSQALAAQTPGVAERLEAAFAVAFEQAEVLAEDPVFAGVAEMQGRFKVEILQQYIGNIRDIVTQELGPALDVTAGFNALDGD
ncbi:imelysin family protein [Shimia marina]|uniref:Iron-regulated protein A n=1 Tax=Shimia marina TaxID=321267 RepID=A0A0P1FCE8_9RHOB|nr:imelysin family protein [Shimia marina]CUH51610.1 Iron-regulated protein A precursor [Shimia marina]SFD44726.1 hypothetical protein SAMN04488037_10158 [Shimia marina]